MMTRRRWTTLALIVAMVVLLLPIPWRVVDSGNLPGMAWRLDGRLEVDGQPADPPGRWSWLAVGRPQLVVEAIWNRLSPASQDVTDMRRGLATRSPALAEPSAAAIGLRAAGRDVPLGLIVEAREPMHDGLPETARIVAIDGLKLDDRQAWNQVASAWENEVELPTDERDAADEAHMVAFSLPDGRRFTAPGPGLPYRVVSILDTAPVDLEAGITFGFARWLPVDWFRHLSLGSSHGMMVALVAYADEARHDLAQGRHIAGTGGIRGDGIVTRIGGLPRKAQAARRAGADVLLFPASQADQLAGEDLGGMTLVPVRTLSEAIEWLSQPVA